MRDPESQPQARRLCVFCGSRFGDLPEYADTARTVGRLLAERGIGLVYGGGRVGLMGTLADGCLDAGGLVFGVIPRGLEEREVEHLGLTELFVVRGMAERKIKMAELADAYLILPGGWGTLDEMFEVLTAAQLGFDVKPCGLLDLGGFYAPLRTQLENMAAAGFVDRAAHRLLQVGDDPAELIDRLVPPP